MERELVSGDAGINTVPLGTSSCMFYCPAIILMKQEYTAVITTVLGEVFVVVCQTFLFCVHRKEKIQLYSYLEIFLRQPAEVTVRLLASVTSISVTLYPCNLSNEQCLDRKFSVISTSFKCHFQKPRTYFFPPYVKSQSLITSFCHFHFFVSVLD